MTEKELKGKIVGNNLKSNILLTLKILFDLIPQVLLVYLISSLIAQNTEMEKLKYIFLQCWYHLF
ncbi:ABC transporter, permease/ATP-binding protein [Treponema vincentii ATCC 35580]|uniref:ABC transporter, permease/ATP-binding protein n=1 Tax=Treponema vincentii ATCC 35580 TaxID=596324 RepID=C8PPZ1_9SPIR|nr:ABC transporter, permease/ATP-binding protein [Treponema vincentii ATCC 35580]